MVTGTLTSPKTAADLLKSRQHFELLDGLRGVAALVVVVFHFLEFVYPDYSNSPAGHGFLAVDFFFCLSGFVIAYAYDDRIGKIGVKEFFKSRLIRLHPLVMFGAVLGLITYLFDPFAAPPAGYGIGQVAVIFITCMLLIPYPFMEERFNNLFLLNAPAWSLFWEYIANIVYALILCKLPRRILLLVGIAAAVWLSYVAYSAGNLLGGWGSASIPDGIARVSFSFTAGMLVYRYNFIIKNKLGFLGLTILLLAALLMPGTKLNWLTELVAVVVYFPLLVALGAGSQLNDRARGICAFSGKISYPLYMTHYGFIWIFGHYYNEHKPGGTELFQVIALSTLALIGLAYLVLKLYDEPLRKYLTGKRKKIAS
ncbi:acyltransferase [uncultured Chitinophaga sp.]|jgi:Predicted acyltransferases|uniref:acyltransferase family protein n=1 Tax=uncultured Chitinophaga sp. TaxID=339340 RepID=UPI00260FFCB4|nr:acyltransferase [uncultured Chitinophaga sp.]